MQETRQVFEKLYSYIGKNIKNLVERPDEDHVFRLHKNRLYYVRESLMRKATNVRRSPACSSAIRAMQEKLERDAELLSVQVSREKLIYLGQAIGKFTHSGKFRLTVGALDLLVQHAKYKVCRAVPPGELPAVVYIECQGGHPSEH